MALGRESDFLSRTKKYNRSILLLSSTVARLYNEQLFYPALVYSTEQLDPLASDKKTIKGSVSVSEHAQEVDMVGDYEEWVNIHRSCLYRNN